MAAAAAVLALALAGCGDDDEGRVSQEGGATDTSTATTTEPGRTATEPRRAPEPEGSPDARAPIGDGHDDGAGDGPEDQPGGAGDEIPASSPVMLTGSDGRISPRLVRVPPFIAVRVELRSGDGATYVLRGGGRSLRAPGSDATPVVFDGLRPGRRLVLRGTGGRVIVEASAEPGP